MLQRMVSVDLVFQHAPLLGVVHRDVRHRVSRPRLDETGAPARTQDAEHLAQDGALVRHVMERVVTRDPIDRGILEGKR